MSATHIETTLYRSSGEVETLVRDFESCALPRADWTHLAHLTVALWYLLHHPAPEATRIIRDRIKRYNRAHGIATTLTSGYHETLTLFWILIVRRYLAEVARADTSLPALANGLLSRYGRKELPLEYYSRERLFSPEARAGWVEPDLKTFKP